MQRLVACIDSPYNPRWMPKADPPHEPSLNYWEIARTAAIVVLTAFLAYRVFGRSMSAPPSTPGDAIHAQDSLPNDIRQRLDQFGWNNRVGHRLGLWVSVAAQRIIGLQDEIVQFVYPCSTAAKGVGNRDRSNQTPLGWHEIAERIGDGLPEGAVFSERKYAGRVWTKDSPTEKDFVLTRILWLRGLEPGINAGKGVDSHERFIYIHGTPAEEKIGTPASMGCIRMRNQHVIALFDQVPTGTPLLITEW